MRTLDESYAIRVANTVYHIYGEMSTNSLKYRTQIPENAISGNRISVGVKLPSLS